MFIRSNLRSFSRRGLLICAACLSLLLPACSAAPKPRVPVATSGAGVNVAEARALLQHLAGADWPAQQIELKSISNGVGGDNAVVEARIETAFRLAKTNGDWRVAEIRLGDRQWESLELLETAVRREKERRTAGLLQRLADGLQAYQRAHGQFVASDDIAVLLDHLTPQFVGDPLRFDLWGTPFVYRGTAAGYELRSAGADRKPGTPDDLVLENGALRSQQQ